MNKLRNAILVLGVIVGIGIMAPAGAYAANSVISEQCAGDTESRVCVDENADPNALIKSIVNVLLFIVGAISVVMIIIGGLLYVLSAGDNGRVTTAKNTIMYAVVGLVVSFIAFAIVQFVFDRFGK